MAKKNTGGLAPHFENATQVQRLIDKYFEACRGTVMKDESGNPIIDRQGKPVITDAEPPTVTGLALALGFTGRLSMQEYRGKREITDAITRGKSLVEKYTETRLFDREGLNGAKFILSSTFKGWGESSEQQPEDEDDPLTKSIEEAALNGIVP